MSKKNQKKSNLKSAILILLLIAILMIASTYAWFTSNKTVTVQEISVSVAASKGLTISTDCVNWKTIISNEDITGLTSTGSAVTSGGPYSGNTNYIPLSTKNLEPVSTDGSITSGLLNMFYGTVEADSDGDLALTAVADTAPSQSAGTGHYVVFDAFIRLDTENASEKVYLTPTSDVTTEGGSSGLKNAARVAFVIEGDNSADTTVTSATTISKYTTSDSTAVKIWEPNYDAHLQAGVDEYFNTYKLTALTTTQLKAGTGSNQVPYVGVAKATTSAIKLKNAGTADGTYLKAVTPAIKTASGNSAAGVEAFTLKKGITKIRVYYWIEGQDIDCENTASGSTIKLNFGFTLNETNS